MKRSLSVLIAGALAAGAVAVAPVGAQEAPAPAVPAKPNVTDPVGDANYLNDQGDGSTTGDHVTPADAASIADIQSAWFTATKDSITAHIETEAPPPATASIMFRLQANPGGDARCLWFQGYLPGAGNTGEGSANLRDSCGEEVATTDGELAMNESASGSGIVSITLPRSASSLLADGKVLASPIVTSRHYVVALTAPQIDTTKPGTDYTIKADGGSSSKPPVKKKNNNKKKCKKFKDKARKKCLKKQKKNKGKKKSKGKKCAAYKPGEQGAEAETTVVTDKATEKSPIEVTIEAPPGVGVGGNAATEALIGHAFQNVQVDSKSKTAGLWVRLEMPWPSDYDLYLNNPDGSNAAHAAGFNPDPALYNDNENGGHTEEEAEQLDGIKSKDCQGYTVDVATATGEGYDLTLKLWLGKAQYDPAAKG